jgi:ATP-dependent RNA helicase DDX18/HAS1
MRQIIKILPSENRQTMLFSATQTTKVEDLARISLRPGPLYINVDHLQKHSTVEGLDQGYVICDSDKRFLLLFSFLKRNLKVGPPRDVKQACTGADRFREKEKDYRLL